jgi:hypothetical protein
MNLRVVVASIAVRGIIVVMMTVESEAETKGSFTQLTGFRFDGHFTIRCDHLVFGNWSSSAKGHQPEQSKSL